MMWIELRQVKAPKGNTPLCGYRRYAVLFLSGFFLMGLGCVKSQTLEEWTKQRKLQTAYKVNQIVALDAYLDGLKKGYGLVRVGWGLVGDIQDGELSLHRDYFSSLSRVHPLVKDYPRAGEILRILGQLNREVDWTERYLGQGSVLNAAEKRMYFRLNRNILERSDRLAEQLDGVLGGFSQDMGDGERMLALEGLWREAAGLYRSMGAFHGQIRAAEVGRDRAESFGKQVKGLYHVR